jgi:hypothetical protein
MRKRKRFMLISEQVLETIESTTLKTQKVMLSFSRHMQSLFPAPASAA